MINRDRPHFVVYQTCSDDPAEQAIMIRKWIGAISISQDEHSISVNYESIPDLIKVLREIQKDPEPDK